MRRVAVFLSDDEFGVLRQRAEKLGLEPYQLANLAVAKMLGTEIPKKKSRWKEFLEDRVLAHHAEGFRGDELGKGNRRVDEIYRCFDLAQGDLTSSELAEKLGISKAKVQATLKNYPEYFELVNPNKGKFETGVWRYIGSSSGQ